MALNCASIFENAPANAPILPLLQEEDEKTLRLLQRYDITVELNHKIIKNEESK